MGELTAREDGVLVGSPCRREDRLETLDNVAGTRSGDGSESVTRTVDVDVRVALHRSGDGADPAGVAAMVRMVSASGVRETGPSRRHSRVNDSTSDGGPLLQAELLRRLLREAASNRLTSCQDQAVLAGDAADLREVVLDLPG